MYIEKPLVKLKKTITIVFVDFPEKCVLQFAVTLEQKLIIIILIMWYKFE